MEDRAEPKHPVGHAEKAYGLLLSDPRDSTRWFLSARIAQRVVRGATVSPIPSSRLGMALIGGRVIPVVALGTGSSELIVCELWDDVRAGVDPAPPKGPTETIAVSGVTVLASGAFTRLDPTHVEFEGESVEALDLALLFDGLE